MGEMYRSLWLAAICLVIVSLLLLAGPDLSGWLFHQTGEEATLPQITGLVQLAFNALRPPLKLAEEAPVAHAGVNPYGVNTFLQNEADPLKRRLAMEMVANAGFHWIRQEFPWEDIEIHGKGDFTDRRNEPERSAWDKYDRIVDLAERYGLELIVRLDNPPAWARADGDARGTLAPPDDLGDFGDFVEAVVTRYKGRVRYYQIWNEPNISPEWGEQDVSPEGYTALLRVAYARAKAADPDCVILCAGLAQTLESGGRNMSDLAFLQRMYDAGAKDSFDIMGVMAYGLWTGPLDRRATANRTNFSRPQLIREIMVRNGDGAKPLWASEVGWNALPADFEGVAAYGRVDEQQQATYAVEAYQRAAREWPWMGVMNYWFLRRPSDLERDQAWYYFRLLEPDFSPLPAYDALSTLGNSAPTLDVGYHQEYDWALRYTGAWQGVVDERAVLGAYVLGQPDAALSFDFEGTALALVLRDPGELDHLVITLDGETLRPARPWSLPADGAPALTLARSLADGRHTVQITAHGKAVGLDGLIVWRRSTPWALWACGGLGALLVAVALLLQKRVADGTA